jgi:hypothetical protein
MNRLHEQHIRDKPQGIIWLAARFGTAFCRAKATTP